MALDQTQNFVEVDITGTYTSTDTTISLESGGASEVPDPANGEYNLVWFDAENNAKPSFDPEVEIVRVTGRDTGNDTLTVQRGQENTSAVAHDTSNADYKFLLTPTSKMISDIDNANFSTNSVQVAGNSVSLGGSTTVDYIDLNDTGSSFPIPNSDLSNSSVSVAGNNVSLGGSTNVNYVDLNDTGSSFPIPNTDLSNSSLTVANTTIALGGSDTPEVDNFNGNNGTSGQFLQTDGSNLSFATVDTFSGDHADLTNVLSDQHHVRPSAGSYLTDSSNTFSVNLGGGVEGDGSDNIQTSEQVAFETGHTAWADGLSSEEIHRLNLQSGETFVVERIEFRQKGGGSSSNASVDVFDNGSASVIGSQNLGGTTKDAGSSNSGSLILVRINNSTGGSVTGSVRVIGYIEGA